MENKVLDARTAIRLLDECLVERGEGYVYDASQTGDRCAYAYNGEPACLVGDVLVRFGVDVYVLTDLGTNVQGVLNHLGISASTAVQSALQHAQSQQDTGTSWGEAVRQARATLAEWILNRHEDFWRDPVLSAS